MLDWKDTAKRMVAHPKWEWREGMWCANCGMFHSDAHVPYAACFPDLTHWATFGLVFGMIEETGFFGWKEEVLYLECCPQLGEWNVGAARVHIDTGRMIKRPIQNRRFDYPGQALGELWLELVEEVTR